MSTPATSAVVEEIPEEPAVVSTVATASPNGSSEMRMTVSSTALSEMEEPQEETLDDEEEALFVEMEKAEENEAVTSLAEQPKEISAAPRLLQQALEHGQVPVDESSEEEAEAAKEEAKKGKAKKESDENEEKKAAEVAPASPHRVHTRNNQLDFLLEKASEYSNFIRNDLQQLQFQMTEEAQKKMEKAERKRKKESGGGKSGSSGKKKRMNNGASEHLKSAQDKDAVYRAGSRPIFIQPPNLSTDCTLKDYQLEGVRWLVSLYENGVSGILADEMGLGKTIQVIALIAHLLTQDVAGPYLVVAPLATLPNWVREFEKWLPVRPVIRYHGNQNDRDAMLRGPLNPKNRRSPTFPFIVTSYEVAIRDQAKLQKLGKFTYLIVDEGHRLKNHRCLLLSSLKKLDAANRLLLTGTPIQNTLEELWSLLNFVNPQIFDDLSVFQSWFGFKDIGQKKFGATDTETILMEQRKNQTVSKLHDILRPFLLRRIKTDVLSEMPPKKEIIVYSGMSKLQKGYGQQIDDGTLRDNLIKEGIEMGRTLSQTNKQMNHRKNINHPFMFGEPLDPVTGLHLGTAYPQLLVRASGKFALLDRMLMRLHKDKHQVLIFSQMTRLLNIIEDYLAFRKFKYCRIDGSTKIDDRQQQMDVFNAEKTSGENGMRNESDDRIFVFLLSTRAGGLGINLTSADTCIIFDSDWNPHQDSQAMDRCHRIGQTRPVAVYRLLTVNSVDIEMMEKQISKKKLERMTIAGGDFRKAGQRSRGEISFQALSSLLEDDIKDLQAKGGDVEDVKIDDEEFELIMDRNRLFGVGPNAIPSEGKMYDVIDAAGGDFLGALNA